jgi:hypothetical protein
MKIANAFAVLLAPSFMFAQSGPRNSDLRIQVGPELTRPNQTLFSPPDQYYLYYAQPDYQTSGLIRMMGELPGMRGFYYGVGGRFETSSRLDFNERIGDTYYDTQDVQLKYSYFSFGAGCIYNVNFWQLGFSVGAHLEGRVEALSIAGPLYENGDFQNPIPLTGRASYLRPWGRVHVDFTFNSRGNIRPFIGVEGAYPLLEREQRHPWTLLDEPQEKRLLESMMPRGSVAAYIGFRL